MLSRPLQFYHLLGLLSLREDVFAQISGCQPRTGESRKDWSSYNLDFLQYDSENCIVLDAEIAVLYFWLVLMTGTADHTISSLGGQF